MWMFQKVYRVSDTKTEKWNHHQISYKDGMINLKKYFGQDFNWNLLWFECISFVDITFGEVDVYCSLIIVHFRLKKKKRKLV
jgi:hypothetical protein